MLIAGPGFTSLLSWLCFATISTDSPLNVETIGGTKENVGEMTKVNTAKLEISKLVDFMMKISFFF